MSFQGSPTDLTLEGPNWVGPVGSTWARFLVGAVGFASWALPAELLMLAWPLFKDRASIANIARLAGDFLVILILAALVQVALPTTTINGQMPVAGSVGELFGELMRSLFSNVGSFLIGLTAIGLILIGRSSFSFIAWVQKATYGTELAATKAASSARAVAHAWERAAELRKQRELEARPPMPRIHDNLPDEAIVEAIGEDGATPPPPSPQVLHVEGKTGAPSVASSIIERERAEAAAKAAPRKAPRKPARLAADEPTPASAGVEPIAGPAADVAREIAAEPAVVAAEPPARRPRGRSRKDEEAPGASSREQSSPDLAPQGPEPQAQADEPAGSGRKRGRKADGEAQKPEPPAPTIHIHHHDAAPAPAATTVVAPSPALDSPSPPSPVSSEPGFRGRASEPAEPDSSPLPGGIEAGEDSLEPPEAEGLSLDGDGEDDEPAPPPRPRERASKAREASHDEPAPRPSPARAPSHDEPAPRAEPARASSRKQPARSLEESPPAPAARAPQAPAQPAARPAVRSPEPPEPSPLPEASPLSAAEPSPLPDDEPLAGDDEQGEHESGDESPSPVSVLPQAKAGPRPAPVLPGGTKVAPPHVPASPASPQPASPPSPPIQIHSSEAVAAPQPAYVQKPKPQPARPFKLPGPDLLDPPPASIPREDPDALRARARELEKVLANYGVKGTVADIHTGPTVSTFEVVPAEGTKVRQVAGLDDDLALGLSCKVRIVAPIPGKSRIGFELPNRDRIPVNLRELVEDRRFQEMNVPLPCVLGRDIVGAPVYADMSSMPHVIVAGATGAGKSVGLNVMLISLLMRRTPEQLRLLMVDPKVVELAPFDRIPHLLLPVVTDMKQASNALKWAVDEMERRYQLFANAGTKNIGTYNGWVERVHKGEVKGYGPGKASVTTTDEGVVVEAGPEKEGAPLPEKLPWIVIVVDEFADLIMQQGKDVEASIARLAQKARAAGMHVILATQRPSTDVITGTIKSNFPSRVAFRVVQWQDSKTILDEKGAEQLLGKGDMLVKLNGASDTRRVQGPFVFEEEVQRVTDWLRAQGEPVYDESIVRNRDEDESGGDDDDGELDPKYDEAVRVVAETQKCSTSWLQRKLGLGYNRAAKIVEVMEKRGVVGPANGAKDREVLIAPL